jgi:ribosomal protein S18 acetylase RimI-like enzyme
MHPDAGLTEPDASTHIVVRPATPADLPAIGRLGELMVDAHHRLDPQRFLPVTSRTAQEYGSYLGRQLDNPAVIVLVAEEHGTVVGYSYAGMEGYDYMSLRGPAGILYDIIVDPGARGRGIGRRLLEATLSFLESRGAPRILLSTAEGNVAAQRLFAGAGFRRTMIEMTRELDGGAR